MPKKKSSRRAPTLTAEERTRRAERARRQLLPAAIKAAGKRGFYGTVEKLEKYKDRITSPERLAGWLKGEAKRRGVLSPEHPYVGRKGYRKYPEAARRMSAKEYRAYLRERREKGPHSPTAWGKINIGLQELIKQ